MKKINLIKSLIAGCSFFIFASPLIVLSNTGCRESDNYLVDGSNWQGHISGTLTCTLNKENHTSSITSNSNYVADSTFTIPDFIMFQNEKYMVTSIGASAFTDCYGIVSIDFGSVTTIDNYAFTNCVNIHKVNLSMVSQIGAAAFAYCSLKSIKVSQANTTYKLVGTSTNGYIQRINDTTILTPACDNLGGIACGNIIFPNNIIEIDGNAFYECCEITSVDFNKVTTIGRGGFWECQKLTSINLHLANTIGGGAFLNCPLYFINIDSQNETYKLVGTSTNGYIQRINDTTILTPACDNLGGIACGNITILPGIVKIDMDTFTNCWGITSFDSGDVEEIDAFAFYTCANLTSVNLTAVTSIEHETFYYCEKLTSVNLGIIDTIGDIAFSSSPIQQITISPENTTFKLVGTSTNGYIQKIEDGAILTSVCGIEGGIACGNITFAPEINEIDVLALSWCIGLRGVNLTTINTLGSSWCWKCPNLSSIIIGNQEYDSEYYGWSDVGPETGCKLYAPDWDSGEYFVEEIIGDSKWEIIV